MISAFVQRVIERNGVPVNKLYQVSIGASMAGRVETNCCKCLVNLTGRNAVIDQFDKSRFLRHCDEFATECFSLRWIMETREIQRGKHDAASMIVAGWLVDRGSRHIHITDLDSQRISPASSFQLIYS